MDHKPLPGLRKIPNDNDRTGRHARWALELDPFDWTEIHKDGLHHLNADATPHRSAVTGPTEQSISCPSPASLHTDERHSSHVNPSSVSSVHNSSHSTDPKPVSCNQPRPHPPGPDLQRASQSVSSTFVLQLPEEDLKKEQQDPILSEVTSRKTRGQKPPYWRMKKHSTSEKTLWQE